MEKNASSFEEKLKRAFKKGLHLPSETSYETLQFAKSSQWDSIAHMQLIATLEEEFGIMIETADMLAMNSYPKAREIVSKHDSASS